MNRDIIRYTGEELQWSTEDVYAVAATMDVEIKSIEDAVEILERTLNDNEHIMTVINEEIADKITEYYE